VSVPTYPYLKVANFYLDLREIYKHSDQLGSWMLHYHAYWYDHFNS